MTYDGLTSFPIDILSKAFPNKYKHVAELQLLFKDANNLEERIWGDGDIRTPEKMNNWVVNDVNVAINNCKQLMFAVKYMQIPEVAALLVTDDIETNLAAIKLNLGNAWQKHVYGAYSGANAKQKDFLKMWVSKFVEMHLGSTGGNAAGGGQQPGGVQTNPAVVKRVKALQAAYADFLQTP
ncbi:hypothetical protein C8A05DRAFT_31887 [Staphylotrichum tortipilum]|uniref:Uncharacterized protein n=1 Tax=Staphylotrichum tortipilum TaxID=2831512 RepID=A0AAN6MPX2_9PEZI|nr:hypothetical protein C8A05DRAFT_31887 [Staphylotrichum longicolle]